MTAPLYQPFWCEENIWQLTIDPLVGAGERQVLLITGASGHVECWNQRVAGPPGAMMQWDYHVALAVRGTDLWQLWDLDTHLGCPVPAQQWLSGTFPCPERVATRLQPRFLLIPADEWRNGLRSDRQHMRTASGAWSQPPPPWPMPQGNGATLADYLGRARTGMDLIALRQRLS